MDQERQFTEYLYSYKNLILKIASLYCYDKEERKDLVQEVILQLWKAFPKYDPSYQSSTWTYKIALNVCISYVRKTTVRNKAIKKYQELTKVQLVEDFQEHENLNKLYKALEILKPIDKAIITLGLDGCSNKEIAEIMGISPSNVSTRLLRIKIKLKNQLNK